MELRETLNIQHEKETRTEIVIIKSLSEGLDQDEIKDKGIYDLYKRGYGYQDVSSESIEPDINEQFRFRKGVEYIAVAESGKKVVAACTLSNMQKLGNNDWGMPFFENLAKKCPELDKRLISAKIYDFTGIVTLPEYQRKGLQRKMIFNAISELDPDIVTGITKTPEAVITRANLFGEKGYRTFYGATEVTPGSVGNDPGEIRPLIESMAEIVEFIPQGSRKGPLMIFPHSMSSAIPDVSKMPLRIKEAFRDVIEEQRSVGHLLKPFTDRDSGESLGLEFSVVKPLISIKKEFLEEIKEIILKTSRTVIDNISTVELSYEHEFI